MSALPIQSAAVVGLGYVGLPLALLAQRRGLKVIGIDVNLGKLERIVGRECPFTDEAVAEELRRDGLEVTADFSRVADVEAVIVCVPTPIDENHLPDLEPLRSAVTSIAPHLRPRHLVIIESSVNPGVCDSVVLPLLESGSNLRAGVDFQLVHCPERINPGDPYWNVENIPRVVGSLEPVGLERATAFYRRLITGEVHPMATLREAEAVKIVENSFRDINIAFVNELARSFTKLGIDVVRVIEAAATKPFAFMAHYPGCGVGGHCIPVDPYYLIEFAKQNGFEHEFLMLARRINESMPAFTVEQVGEALGTVGRRLAGSTVAVLGLAYKPNIDDCRESPSFVIIEHLTAVGATVRAFDPFVPSRSTVPTLAEALRGAEAVVVATAHEAFCKLEPSQLVAAGVRVVVDGRNCLPASTFTAAGIVYRGIGRAA